MLFIIPLLLLLFFFFLEHAISKTWVIPSHFQFWVEEHCILCSEQTTFLALVKTRISSIWKLRCYDGLMGSDVYMKDQWSEFRLNNEWWMFCIVSLSLIKSTKLLNCYGLLSLFQVLKTSSPGTNLRFRERISDTQVSLNFSGEIKFQRWGRIVQIMKNCFKRVLLLIDNFDYIVFFYRQKCQVQKMF